MVLSLRSEMEKCMIEKVFLASCFETLMMLFEKFRCDDVSKKKRLRRFFLVVEKLRDDDVQKKRPYGPFFLEDG